MVESQNSSKQTYNTTTHPLSVSHESIRECISFLLVLSSSCLPSQVKIDSPFKKTLPGSERATNGFPRGSGPFQRENTSLTYSLSLFLTLCLPGISFKPRCNLQPTPRRLPINWLKFIHRLLSIENLKSIYLSIDIAIWLKWNKRKGLTCA